MDRLNKSGNTTQTGTNTGPTTTTGTTTAFSLNYGISATWFFQGAAISPLIPTTTGTITGCTASPSLPAGLTIDSTTCTISGTPASTQNSVTYTMTATNGLATATAQLTLRVANTAATRVYGQLGSFASNTINNGGISADSLNYSYMGAIDTNVGLYLNDYNNSRTLHFNGTSTTADRVYGQLGSYATATVNNGGISANSLNVPYGVAAESSGVYIADEFNNRVLHYSGTSTTADRVYGQLGSFISNTANNGGISANSLNGPRGVTIDTNGIYIADWGNNRVLHYSGTSTTADRVYGQLGSFTSATANNGGISANSLNGGRSIALDSSGIYIVDETNHRVLHYSGTSTTADRVYGQLGSFATGTANNGGISANSLLNPYDVAIDIGGVYIADSNNNRVLHYSGSSTTADRVYGQLGNFTSATVNNGGITASSLNVPAGIVIDTSGLYIMDRANSRVLFY